MLKKSNILEQLYVHEQFMFAPQELEREDYKGIADYLKSTRKKDRNNPISVVSLIEHTKRPIIEMVGSVSYPTRLGAC
jgi:hypothetical protein